MKISVSKIADAASGGYRWPPENSAADQQANNGRASRTTRQAGDRWILGAAMTDDEAPTNDDTALAAPGEPDSDQPAAETKRVVGRPFRPGVSGNPSGRPKMSADEQETLRVGTKIALSSLLKVARDPKHAGCVRACELLLDRRYGRPVAAISGVNGEPLFPAGAPVGDSPLDALLARLAARRTAAEPTTAATQPEPANTQPAANGEAKGPPPS